MVYGSHEVFQNHYFIMKQFFKFFTASCLGTIAALGVIALLFFAIGGAMASQKPPVAKKTVLKLSLSGVIPEKSGNVASSGTFSLPEESLGLRHIKKLIEHAATDDRISGILISNTEVSAGQATLKSIRESVEVFKESDKFVYAYADYMSQSAYYLASVADSVYINPQGMVDVKGFGTLVPFFTEMLEDIGVEMEVFYAGDFKSATEPFRRTEMSPENELQTKQFLNSMLTLYQEQVAASRGLTVADVDQIMHDYAGRTATGAIDAGLIDGAVYIDEVESLIKRQLDIDDDKKIKYKTLSDYNTAVDLPKAKGKNKIAVIYAEGTVNYGTDDKGEINESNYLKYINKAKNDDKIKAIVLRVNSGGGSSLTSDIIWRALEQVKAAGKPVIASFGDYAASGGYYIAAGADTIVAEPNTLTGSIGVFAMLPNASDLMTEKLGIYFDTVKTHTMAIGLTPVYDISKEEGSMIKESVDDIYDTFLSRVADGRGMSKAAVHEIAQGRVWTGEKGKEIGLVDVLGSLDDAIEIAAQAANVDDYKISEYPYIKETFVETLMKSIAESEGASAALGLGMSKQEKALFREVRASAAIYLDRSPQARLPYTLRFD